MGAQMQCPHCGEVYGLTDEQVPQYSGRTITCTKCQKAFTVPTNLGGAVPPAVPPVMPAEVGYGLPTSHYTGRQQGNGLAIASVVCGAIGFIIPLLPGVLGIIFGILGLRRTRNPAVGGKAAAITGISLSAATFLLLPCMISILLPSLNRARETANRVKCAANMKAIGQAIMLYANENRGAYPPTLQVVLETQDVSSEMFVCPASDDTPAQGTGSQLPNLMAGSGHLSYVYVGQRLNPQSPRDAIILYEAMTDHSNDGGNFLFADGHVEFLRRVQAEKVIAQVQAGINPPR